MKRNDIWRDYEIFATLTYPRDESLRQKWLKVTTDSNRFVQQLERGNKYSYMEYLRVIESHKDGYPYLHFHIRFGTDIQVRDRDIYLPDYVREFLREAARKCKFGLTDFQCPRTSKGGTIAYCLKYIQKGAGNRLWSLILDPTVLSPQNEDDYPHSTPRYAGWKLISLPLSGNLFLSSFKWKKIKLLTWSRGYVATFKTSKF